MTDASTLDAHFPDLVTDEALRQALERETAVSTLAPDEFICMEGARCAHLALVLDGRARVYKSGAEGRELTLYRVHPGESCILTTSCILSNRPFPAFAVSETALTARMVPAPLVRSWMERFRPWRSYIFDLLARRLDRVIATLEEVAFRRLDSRLAGSLLEACQSQDTKIIQTTHNELAADLGSTREVISRLLKHFERDGLVTRRRGEVEIRDPDGLAGLAEGHRA